MAIKTGKFIVMRSSSIDDEFSYSKFIVSWRYIRGSSLKGVFLDDIYLINDKKVRVWYNDINDTPGMDTYENAYVNIFYPTVLVKSREKHQTLGRYTIREASDESKAFWRSIYV